MFIQCSGVCVCTVSGDCVTNVSCLSSGCLIQSETASVLEVIGSLQIYGGGPFQHR